MKTWLKEADWEAVCTAGGLHRGGSPHLGSDPGWSRQAGMEAFPPLAKLSVWAFNSIRNYSKTTVYKTTVKLCSWLALLENRLYVRSMILYSDVSFPSFLFISVLYFPQHDPRGTASIHPSIYLLIYLSINLYIYLLIYILIYLFSLPSIYLSIFYITI